jgi:hypothetical protein
VSFAIFIREPGRAKRLVKNSALARLPPPLSKPNTPKVRNRIQRYLTYRPPLPRLLPLTRLRHNGPPLLRLPAPP